MAFSNTIWWAFFIVIVTAILTGPEGFPHMATDEDEYNGYYIPKGTVVLGNAWSGQPITLISVLTFLFRSILHDPKVFDNPTEYQPERYLKDGKLNPDVRDPLCVTFGFGRRSVDPTYSMEYIS